MLPQRIIDKIDATGICWIWTGCILSTGYGQVHDPDTGKRVGAHRHVYELMVGPIKPGLHLDHLCRNRPCVNPDHLEPVTPAENARRARRGIHWDETCIRGHDDWRVDPDGKHRRCRTCAREGLREWKRRAA